MVLLRETGDGCSGIMAFECSHFHLLSVSDRRLALTGRPCWTDALRLRGVDDAAAPDVDAGNGLP